jgi:hypothetical protein
MFLDTPSNFLLATDIALDGNLTGMATKDQQWVIDEHSSYGTVVTQRAGKKEFARRLTRQPNPSMRFAPSPGGTMAESSNLCAASLLKSCGLWFPCTPFKFGKRAAGEPPEFSRRGGEFLSVIRAARLERGEPATKAGEFIRRQLRNDFDDFFDFHVAQYSTSWLADRTDYSFTRSTST